MIDIHCHILPGIDDGPKDIETSLKMLRIAEEDGIKTVIATPHFYRGFYENQYGDVEEEVKKLNIAAKENNINVEILPGQEIFLDKYTLDYYKSGVVRGLNNSKYMLIELEPDIMPEYVLDIIYELRLLGVKPIIAHPERYSYVIDDITILNKFIEEECFFQLSSGSITGTFGKAIQKTSVKLIKNEICDFIASDAHSTGRRKPRLKEALMYIQQMNKEKYEKILMNTNEMSKNNEIVYSSRKIIENKGILGLISSKLSLS